VKLALLLTAFYFVGIISAFYKIVGISDEPVSFFNRVKQVNTTVLAINVLKIALPSYCGLKPIYR